MTLDDFLDTFNWISRLEGVAFWLTTFLPSRDLFGEVRIVPGTVEIQIERYGADGQIAHTGGDAERLLRWVRIPVHGKRVTHDAFIFVVPARQGKWAEYLLLRAGVRLAPGHRMIDPCNARWAARHAGPVPMWDEQTSKI